MTKPNGKPELSRPLPFNLDAERSVLGAILLDNASLARATELVLPEDFFLDQHKHVLYQMQELHGKNISIDLVTLTEELAKNGELEISGGAPYLASLADGMPKVSNVEHYARIVKEKSLLRGLIHATNAIQMQAFDGEGGAAAILDNARATLTSLLGLQPKGGLVSASQIVRDNFDRLEKIFTGGRNVTGLPTGYANLDGALAGLQPSELTVLAARPSNGKTSLALNVAENVAIRSKLPVAFFSLEMSAGSLLTRLLAAICRINAHKFRTGHLSREDWTKMTEALVSIATAPLWVDDSSNANIYEIAARSERLKNERGLSLIVVDYLQLIGSRSRGRSRQEEVSEISRGLKALAKDLAVPVLALSQLTRAPDREERAPLLSDLRESGAIEQDADVVLFIHRPNLHKPDADQAERDRADVIIAKQRNGPVDIIRFVFLSQWTRFEEAVPDGFDFERERT